VEDWSLALCDFQTLDIKEDLVPIDVVDPHYIEEAFEVTQSSKQKWYYLSKYRPDDVVLLKMFDNATDGRAFCKCVCCEVSSYNKDLTASHERCSTWSF
jgi:hypothetical protein